MSRATLVYDCQHICQHGGRKRGKEEGLLVGGSSGSAMMAMLQEAKNLKEGQNCVIVLPDGIRNYLTKFVDEDWRKENGFA